MTDDRWWSRAVPVSEFIRAGDAEEAAVLAGTVHWGHWRYDPRHRVLVLGRPGRAGCDELALDRCGPPLFPADPSMP
jgi:hypothetical protein